MEPWIDRQMGGQVDVSAQGPHCVEIIRSAQVPKLQFIDWKPARLGETVQVWRVLPNGEAHVRGCRRTAAQKRHRCMITHHFFVPP